MQPNSQNLAPTGPGIALTFLYYFSMTVGIVVVTGSRFLDLAYTSPRLYQYGMGLGLGVGLVAVLINRNLTMDIALRIKPASPSSLIGFWLMPVLPQIRRINRI